ncbi:MAG: DUF2946 family protein [Proteobacteria bacterium]|nr:DUF2946 family protein [Pseudomonadota bacterium]
MDDIVKQALAKWPNVPHCYGWLALDARGNWRMRDERAQTLQLPGDKLTHPALLGFINRNYEHDEHGRWFFQNGPQRVYVNLETTPHIARTDPRQSFVLHTGAAMPVIEAVWFADDGGLVLQSGHIVAQLDDRDLAQCLARLEMDGKPVSDADLLNWLAGGSNTALRWRHNDTVLSVGRIARTDMESRFGYVRQPLPLTPLTQ